MGCKFVYYPALKSTWDKYSQTCLI
jgi:hypothetical protein